jgi:hypothetical protein
MMKPVYRTLKTMANVLENGGSPSEKRAAMTVISVIYELAKTPQTKEEAKFYIERFGIDKLPI